MQEEICDAKQFVIVEGKCKTANREHGGWETDQGLNQILQVGCSLGSPGEL